MLKTEAPTACQYSSLLFHKCILNSFLAIRKTRLVLMCALITTTFSEGQIMLIYNSQPAAC